MRRTGKDADGIDRTGKRGHAYLAAREAGWSLRQIAAEFGVGETGVSAAIQRAERRAAKRSPKKATRPAG